jgi:hypothetical protein
LHVLAPVSEYSREKQTFTLSGNQHTTDVMDKQLLGGSKLNYSGPFVYLNMQFFGLCMCGGVVRQLRHG